MNYFFYSFLVISRRSFASLRMTVCRRSVSGVKKWRFEDALQF